MITQTSLTTNKKQSNIKRAAKIIYLLKVHGITQKSIAEELGIEKQTVNKVIWGGGTSARINTWLKENLGV
ncbi:helix-turn-helix domain-containing protein [bacterium]|nr:helix-turn-helix domain-containing protein [bacterium]